MFHDRKQSDLEAQLMLPHLMLPKNIFPTTFQTQVKKVSSQKTNIPGKHNFCKNEKGSHFIFIF